MSAKPPVNWNTAILTLGLAGSSFFGKELYQEVRATHDAVMLLRAQISQLVPRSEFDLQIAEIKARIATIEIEMQRFKEHKTM